MASVEAHWIGIVQGSGGAPEPLDGEEQYEDNFRIGDDESLASILERYRQVAAATAAVVAGIADLDQPVPVPPGVPWFPDDIEAWSVRWVLVHLITETARHAGHADIVRETIDGATAFPLMAAAEGWPATEWMQPWSPDRLATAAG